MCGIAGIFNFSSNDIRINRVVLEKMNSAMINRGPDGSGYWFSGDNKVAFTHRRLSIIDVDARSNQPMVFENYVIVFNGEIYNYKKLRSDLKAQGDIFKTESDTEVILHLYAKYKNEMFNMMRGMYSLAIWDSKKQAMVLARDPFGIKPLYYYMDDKEIIVASQVKAIANSVEVSLENEPAGHVGFLLLGSVPEPYTIYKGIYSLGPGQVMKIDRGGRCTTHRFADVADLYKKNITEDFRAGEESKDSGKYLYEIVKETIDCHLVSDVPVGIYLSSGIDSSVISVIASETVKKSMVALTATFEENEKRFDEYLLSSKLAEQCGLTQIKIHFTVDDFMGELDNILNCMDQPTIDGINVYMISKKARELGIKTVLTGLGADEVFGGYPSFRNISKIYKFHQLMSKIHIPDQFINWGLNIFSSYMDNDKINKIWDYGSSIAKTYVLYRGLFFPKELFEILDREYVEEGLKKLNLFDEMDISYKTSKSIYDKVSLLEMQWYMKNQLLRDADWAGMAHSIEIRVPFVDYYFLKKLKRLSKKYTTKLALANTVSNKVPREIFTRKKSGFTIPLKKWYAEVSGETGLPGYKGWAMYVYDRFHLAL